MAFVSSLSRVWQIKCPLFLLKKPMKKFRKKKQCAGSVWTCAKKEIHWKWSAAAKGISGLFMKRVPLSGLAQREQEPVTSADKRSRTYQLHCFVCPRLLHQTIGVIAVNRICSHKPLGNFKDYLFSPILKITQLRTEMDLMQCLARVCGASSNQHSLLLLLPRAVTGRHQVPTQILCFCWYFVTKRYWLGFLL